MKKERTSVDKDVEKLEASHVTGGSVKWHSCCGEQLGGSSVIKHRLTV